MRQSLGQLLFPPRSINGYMVRQCYDSIIWLEIHKCHFAAPKGSNQGVNGNEMPLTWYQTINVHLYLLPYSKAMCTTRGVQFSFLLSATLSVHYKGDNNVSGSYHSYILMQLNTGLHVHVPDQVKPVQSNLYKA